MARKAKNARQTPQTARQRRQEALAEAAKQRRNQNALLIGSGVFLLLIIAFFLYLNFRTQPGVSGEIVFESQGNNHIEFGSPSPIAYNSVPPTSGPHYPGLRQWQVYDEPIRYEEMVHNMEDGGVIVYYQCEEDCPELVEQLTDSVQPYIDGGRHVAMLPNQPGWSINNGQSLHEDMGAPIVLTAWTRMLKLDEYDADRIDAFIRRYEGIDNHVRY